MLRIKELQKQLKQAQVDGVLFQEPLAFFYLTGLRPSSGKLLVDGRGAAFFVDGRYFQEFKTKSPCPLFLLQEKSFEVFLKKRLKKGALLAFDSLATSVAALQDLKRQIRQEPLQKSALILKPLRQPLKDLRSLKDARELKKLRLSARLNYQGFEYIKSLLKTGISERELALEFELFVRRRGAEKLAFEPIIAFGPNSAFPHHASGSAKLKKGQAVLMDLGVLLEGYNSDMTRTVFFGPAEARLKQIYQIVLQAQKAALRCLKPGVRVASVDKKARGLVEKAGFGRFFPHSLGHGVGLQVHEFPALNQKGVDRKVKLKAGMVVTIEPGIYLPGLGGVRLEDTVAITEKGFESFYPPAEVL
ncbi:MAG: aminopeptidase P family protein [Parachlamydiales bacterium]|jgi:Xaa-Pro aminopeptidase